MRKPSSGASSIINWRRDASLKAMILRSPILRSALMRGAGSASKGSKSPNLSISIAGLRSLRCDLDSSNLSPRQCLDGQLKQTRSLEQHDTNDRRKRDGRHHEAYEPAHAAAHPPQQRATHEDENEDIEPQWISVSFCDITIAPELGRVQPLTKTQSVWSLERLNSRKCGFAMACPPAQTPLYVRRRGLDQISVGIGHGAIAISKALICR